MKTDWHQVVLEFGKSGLTAKQFCKERNLDASAFSYHKRKYAKLNGTSGFVEVGIDKEVGGSYEIEYPNGVKLRFLKNVSKSTLRSLIYV